MNAEQAINLMRRLGRHAPTGTTVLLWLAIAWYGAKLVWLGFSTAPQILPTAPASLVLANTTNRESNTFQLEFANTANWFGAYDPKQTVSTPVAEENLQATALDLTLMGTLASSDPRIGYALIRSDKNTEKNYRVGDAITRQAALHSVYPRKVVLNRNGALEELRLPEDFKAKPASQARQTASRAQRTTSTVGQTRPPLNSDLIRLTEVIRHTAKYSSEGEFEGIKVFAGRERKAFIQSGLRPGDVVTAINGQTFASLDEAAKALLTLPENTTVALSINRNDRETQLDFNPSEILATVDEATITQ